MSHALVPHTQASILLSHILTVLQLYHEVIINDNKLLKKRETEKRREFKGKKNLLRIEIDSFNDDINTIKR